MFELKHITIQNHSILKSVSFQFNSDVDRDPNNIFSTVIIGPNGIGKSYLLRAIADIFIYLNDLKNGQNARIDFKFMVSYSIGNANFSVSVIDGTSEMGHLSVANDPTPSILCFCNENRITLQELSLPKRVVVSTLTVADKFNAKSDGFYAYRGLRSEKTPSMTGTRTIVRKMVNSISNSLYEKATSRDELKHLLDILGFEPHIEIRYKMHYRDIFFQYGQSKESLKYLYEHQNEIFSKRTSKVWGTKYFESIKDDDDKLELVTSLIQRMAQHYESVQDYVLVYNPLDDNTTLVGDREAIQILTNLDILTFPELLVTKQNSKYEFINSSSGETQQLCQFLSIMSAIKENSLVIIDEPENSSHPNWQIRYIDWLKDIFSRYASCHFIIATHSHFLLTDLKVDSSRIIALKKNNNRIEDVAEGQNTYCWSVDDILYNVFQIRNTRNAAFESDMYTLLNLVSNGEETSLQAQELIEKLSAFILPGNDPLKQLLNKIKSC